MRGAATARPISRRWTGRMRTSWAPCSPSSARKESRRRPSWAISATRRNRRGSSPKRRMRWARIDALVSNAGIAAPAPLTRLGLDEWDLTMNVNTRATWLLGKAAHPHLKESRGAIAVTASMSGMNPHSGMGAYSASKAGVIILAKQMAQEWAADGIRVNCVSPGLVRTAMTEAMYVDPEVKAAREALVPMGPRRTTGGYSGHHRLPAGPRFPLCHRAGHPDRRRARGVHLQPHPRPPPLLSAAGPQDGTAAGRVPDRRRPERRCRISPWSFPRLRAAGRSGRRFAQRAGWRRGGTRWTWCCSPPHVAYPGEMPEAARLVLLCGRRAWGRRDRAAMPAGADWRAERRAAPGRRAAGRRPRPRLPRPPLRCCCAAPRSAARSASPAMCGASGPIFCSPISPRRNMPPSTPPASPARAPSRPSCR